jgi:DNA-directed RNA polymerase specialized sigma24 family protein
MQQLNELLADPDFRRMIALVSREVMSTWNVSFSLARGAVLSAIGEPKTLTCIYQAWTAAKHTGANLGLAMVIIRRRVISLLRKDARPAGHCSLPATPEDLEYDPALGSFDQDLPRNARAELEYRQILQMVRGALACFAAQGARQRRQAELLHRRFLDEAAYAELSVELACSERALRVRVHKAIHALGRHIQGCHPELVSIRRHMTVGT